MRGSDFQESSSLKRHEKIHQEDYKLEKCDECPKTFMNIHDMRRHMTLVQHYVEFNRNPYFPICRESRPFVCDFCDDTFKTKYNCERNNKTIQNTEKSFVFKFSAKCFPSKYNADRHSESWCQLRSSAIVCPIIDDFLEFITEMI